MQRKGQKTHQNQLKTVHERVNFTVFGITAFEQLLFGYEQLILIIFYVYYHQEKIYWRKSTCFWAIIMDNGCVIRTKNHETSKVRMWESFWQKDSLITYILFELCLIWYISPVANFGNHPLCFLSFISLEGCFKKVNFNSFTYVRH